ncbi:HAD family hydrolase [Methanolobus profundi]|uniref:Putative hydrolase of the HAD superfamily n=1 Tax=Methanolobus profundi TaxID=487685 RepID=A0A1I4UJC4_9EURY|nr:HAD family hydrolase [Methanolobus profundi]SFM88995.1 putative hydrolase of the HAD superfamily [Methanolobus profundi]
MIKVIIFDLDNTLYNEKEYVISGFKAVALFLAREKSLDYCTVYSSLLESFVINERGKNFNYLCNKLNIDKSIIRRLVDVYREHYPEISLKEDIEMFLLELSRKYKLCLLTNGWLLPQKMKVESLRLDRYFDTIYYSQQDGLDLAKPHPKYFMKILQFYKIEASEALMIGDDPVADIQGAKDLNIPYFQISNELDDNEKQKIMQFLHNNI